MLVERFGREKREFEEAIRAAEERIEPRLAEGRPFFVIRNQPDWSMALIEALMARFWGRGCGVQYVGDYLYFRRAV